MHFIYHSGKVKDVETLDQMYKKKPEKQLMRISFDQGFYLGVDNQTNEMKTEGLGVVNQAYWDVSRYSLVKSGAITQIVWEWEILKIFFDNNNVVPQWTFGNMSGDEFDEETGEPTAGLITTVRYRIINK